MILEFEILGKAKAKQSCRFTRNGFKYTPSDIVQYSNLVKISFINSYPNWDIQTFKDKALSDLYENGKTEDRKYKKICRNID